MKRFISVLSVLLAAALALSCAAAAAEAEGAPDDGGAYAVLTLSNGETVASRAPSARQLGSIDSYQLILEDEIAMSADRVKTLAVNDMGSGGYYSVSFTVPGTSYDVFLTGLTADNVEEVQQYIIDHYNGKNFDIEDLSFIDAEKTKEEDNDDYLCWAATASNMLTYTGWAAQAGFDSEDDVFDAFVEAFTDNGSNPQRGIAWFMNGSSMNDNSGYDDYAGEYAVIEDYPNSGGYLKDYAFDSVTGFVSYEDFYMEDCIELLKDENCSIGLALTITYLSTGETGGHAVTMWGCVEDTSKSVDDPERYVDIIISDSDSDEKAGVDRREAPNIYSMYSLTWDGAYYSFNYSSKVVAYLEEYTYLIPYSPELDRETDPDADRSKMTTPDLAFDCVYLMDDDMLTSIQDVFESGSTIYFMGCIINQADVSYSELIDFTAVITDSEGNEICRLKKVYSLGGDSLDPTYFITPRLLSFPGISEGDYTITYILNADRSVDEAYYYNNEVSVDFAVRDSYLVGDADNNGEISILDVTRIQRRLAGYTLNMDEKVDERCDINGNGLSILDATIVQRWLTGKPVNSPIGEKRLYN